MKVVIDHDRCSGHGRCYSVAPTLFTDDDAGYGQLRDDGTVEPAQMAEAERAVLACPELAITLASSE
jgi:ferredoxin